MLSCKIKGLKLNLCLIINLTPKIIGYKSLKHLIYIRKPLLRPFKKVEKFHNGYFEYQILESNGKI